MMGRLLLLVLALCCAGFARAANVTRPPDLPPEIPWPPIPLVRLQHGDDPGWAALELDDSTWQEIPRRELPSRAGIYWVRWRVTRPPAGPQTLRDGLLIKVVASYDLYWDGRLIGRNGRVGRSASEEIPGDVDALFQIPAELLTPGEHVVALRMSSFHTGFPGPNYSLLVTWGNFRSLLVQRSRTALLSVMAVGAALIGGTVFGLMWLLAGRRLALALLSALFLCAAAMQALQAWRWLFEYPYSWHYPRLVVITALATGVAALLPAFVLHHFRVGRARWVYAVLAAGLTAAWLSTEFYNFIGLLACGIGLVIALALALWAVRVRRRGAWMAAAGLAGSVVALLTAPMDFLDHAFFLTAGPAALGLLVAVVLQLREERREAQEARLTAARLQTELLKKNIQPHFLVNTLATVQEVIEREPKTAVAMIDALASEFRILNRVAGEKLIPLGQELELCRAHLEVMSRRKGARCALRTTGADDDVLVPPALFHTLIENGLTHLMPRAGVLEFELRKEQRPDATRYVVLARGERQAQSGVPGATREGTGMRYIKARLEESFPGKWSLTAGPVLEGWETIIEIAPKALERTRQPRSDADARPPTLRRAEEPA